MADRKTITISFVEYDDSTPNQFQLDCSGFEGAEDISAALLNFQVKAIAYQLAVENPVAALANEEAKEAIADQIKRLFLAHMETVTVMQGMVRA